MLNLTYSMFNQQLSIVPFISINVQMDSAFHFPSCVTTMTIARTTVTKKAVVSNRSSSVESKGCLVTLTRYHVAYPEI